MNALRPALAACVLVASASAQQTTYQIALNHNFNGIVHAGEAGNPDDPAGFRSISDRALDFSGGVPASSLLAPYSIVSTPGVLDIVHVGNRNLVDNGNHAFDAAPDGDDVGVQPNWLTNVDQTSAQTTVLAAPILLEATSTVRVLYQVSNGGGSFDVAFGFQNGTSTFDTLFAADWFGGLFPGTGAVDSAVAAENLSIVEATIDLSAFAGRTLTSISFQNPTNPVAGIAVVAVNVVTDPRSVIRTPVPLDHNFNGIAHAGESNAPDDPNGYRSISDRGLEFSAGPPSLPLTNRYELVNQAGVLDIVHLGNRDLVDNGNWAFDAVADGDDVGVQPAWLASSDQNGPQTTTLATPIAVEDTSEFTLIYHASNGGSGFDVRLGFQSGSALVESVWSGDWFGGPFPGAELVDSGLIGGNLNLVEARLDLASFAGDALTSVTFENKTNANAGVAVFAANVTTFDFGVAYCGPGVPNSSGSPGEMGVSGSPVVSVNDLTLMASSLPTFSFGFFLTSRTQAFVQNPGGSQGNLCLGGAIGRYVGAGQIQNTGNNGAFSLPVDLTLHPTPTGFVQVMPGETWNFQAWHRDSVGGMATSNFTDGRSVRFF